MELTAKIALNMINDIPESQKDKFLTYVSHCTGVGDAAAEIAKVLNLDVEKARMLGYIHDIGKLHNVIGEHEIDGYEYLKSLGVDDEIAGICVTHSFIGGDVDMTAGGIRTNPVFAQYLPKFNYTIYSEIVNVCDLMVADKLMTFEERMIDLLIRKGVHSNTHAHILAAKNLKNKFDNLCGQDIYLLAKAGQEKK